MSKDNTKLRQIAYRRGLIKFFSNFKWRFFNFIWILSVVIFFLVLFGDVAHKVPLISYFASELELPLSLNYQGTITIYNEDGTKIDSNLKISIGGFSTLVANGNNFNIKFISSNRDRVPIVIQYKYNNEILYNIKHISYKDTIYTFEENYDIYK